MCSLLQILLNETHGPSADPPAPIGQCRPQRRLLRPQEGRRREGQQLFVLDEHRVFALGPPEAHHPSLDVPDGRAHAVQQPHETDVRRDTERVGYPGEGSHQGFAVAGDGQGDAENPNKEPQDERDRAVARVLRERLVHVEAAPRQDTNGRGEGRERAGETRDEKQGGRGQEARDRSGDRAYNESASTHGTQHPRGRGDGATEESVFAVAGDNQEENRGADRTGVSGAHARG